MKGDWVPLSVAVRYVRRVRGGSLDERAQQLLRSRLLNGDIMGEALVSSSQVRSPADVGSRREEIGPEFWNEVVVFWHLDLAQRYRAGPDPSGVRAGMQEVLQAEFPGVPVDPRKPRQLARKIRLLRSDLLHAFPSRRGSKQPDPSSPKRAGGRPAKESWFGLAAYLAAYIVENDYPKTQADLVRVAEGWFKGQGLKEDRRQVEKVVGAMYAERDRLRRR